MKRYNKIIIKEEEKEKKSEDINIKEVLKALSLFFVLTLFTLLMISGKFRQGVENFWGNNEKAAEAVEKIGLETLFEA